MHNAFQSPGVEEHLLQAMNVTSGMSSQRFGELIYEDIQRPQAAPNVCQDLAWAYIE